MIIEVSRQAVDDARWNEHFLRPLYDTYGFARIPRLIEALFADEEDETLTSFLGPLAGRYDKVALLFVDAFGWEFLERYQARYPFLQRLIREGIATKLTSQFPSTTSAHVTTIHTGLPVGASGLYEWFMYEPQVDEIIAPLLYSFAGDKDRDTLKRTGIDPSRLFPQATLYQRLQQQGVRSYVFQGRDSAFSPFSTIVCRGAQVCAYKDLSDGLCGLRDIISGEKGRSYAFLYFPGIDAAGHKHGPRSSEFAAQVDLCFTLLENHIGAGKLRNTLLLLTADHGMAVVDPATTIFLNRTIPDIARWLKSNRWGKLLVPAGSCRDLFLHIKDEHLEEVHSRLQEHLAGRADVHRVDDLIAAGFFGPSISPTFRSRVGNLVILPYGEEAVWWYEQDRFVQPFYGHHGGLTPAEMETELLALAYR